MPHIHSLRILKEGFVLCKTPIGDRVKVIPIDFDVIQLGNHFRHSSLVYLPIHDEIATMYLRGNDDDPTATIQLLRYRHKTVDLLIKDGRVRFKIAKKQSVLPPQLKDDPDLAETYNEINRSIEEDD